MFDAVYGKRQLQISVEGINFDNIPQPLSEKVTKYNSEVEKPYPKNIPKSTTPNFLRDKRFCQKEKQKSIIIENFKDDNFVQRKNLLD